MRQLSLVWTMAISAALAGGCGGDTKRAGAPAGGGDTTGDTQIGTDGTGDTQMGTDDTDDTQMGTDGTVLPDDCEIEPTFSSIHENYFQNSCALSASCHQGSPGAGGLSLDLDVAYDQLVGEAAVWAPSDVRVVPGDPDASFLIRKLEGNLEPSEGDLMPQGIGMPYDPECRIAAIRQWIADGAPNN